MLGAITGGVLLAIIALIGDMPLTGKEETNPYRVPDWAIEELEKHRQL